MACISNAQLLLSAALNVTAFSPRFDKAVRPLCIGSRSDLRRRRCGKVGKLRDDSLGGS